MHSELTLHPANLEQIQVRMGKLTRRHIPVDSEQPRRAAVLIPLCIHQGEPAVLFTKRTDDMPTHKGQVSFPGGMKDPSDQSSIETALRESREEVGIQRAHTQILGVGNDVRAITGVPVTPVVGFLGELDTLEDLTPDPREIEQLFLLRFRELFDPEKRHRVHHEGRGSYPVFQAGPWPVWGLTAYMLDEFFEIAFSLTLWDGMNPVAP